MPSELIQRIREQSEINRTHAGDDSANADSSYHDLLREIQQRVSQELARRVNATLDRFSERLERLPTTGPVGGSAAVPAGPSASDIQRRLERIQSSLTDLVSRIDRLSHSVNDRGDAPQMTIADLRQQLEEWWRDCELQREEPVSPEPRSDEADSPSIGEMLSAKLEALQTQVDERLCGLEGLLSDSNADSDEESTLTAVRESIAKLESTAADLLARLESESQPQPPESAPISEIRQDLIEEIGALEQRLGDRLSEGFEAAQAHPPAIDLDLSRLETVQESLEKLESSWQAWVANDSTPREADGSGLEELREALLVELREAEERASGRIDEWFEKAAENAVPEPGLDAQALDPLTQSIEQLEKQWAHFLENADAQSSSDPLDDLTSSLSEWRETLTRELAELEARLAERLPHSTDDETADTNTDIPEEAWQTRLDVLQSQMERRFEELGERWKSIGEASGDGETARDLSVEDLLARLDRLEESLPEKIAQARQSILEGNDRETPAPESGEPFSELRELEERLNSAVIALAQHAEAGRLGSGGSIDEEALYRCEARLLDAIQKSGRSVEVNEESMEPPSEDDRAQGPAQTKLSESLWFARMESLEESLQSFVEKGSENVTQTLLDRCLELEHTVPAQVAEAMMGSPASKLEFPESLMHLPDVVISLRRDFSLLVHTVNNHLEDSRDQIALIADAVVERLRETPAFGASKAESNSAAAQNEAEDPLAGLPTDLVVLDVADFSEEVEPSDDASESD